MENEKSAGRCRSFFLNLYGQCFVTRSLVLNEEDDLCTGNGITTTR